MRKLIAAAGIISLQALPAWAADLKPGTAPEKGQASSQECLKALSILDGLITLGASDPVLFELRAEALSQLLQARSSQTQIK